MKPTEQEKSSAKSIIPFVTEVARYFMDFLETDFHKVRNPKRQIQFRNSDNLQTCIDLNKYKKYTSLVWKIIRSGFYDDDLNELKHGVYIYQISTSLLQLIEEQIKLIQPSEIEELIKQFDNEIILGLHKNPNDTAAATNFAVDGISRVIREKFIANFITKIRVPIEKITDSTVDSVYQIEESLTDILVKPLEDVLTTIINDHKLEKKSKSLILLKQFFDLQDTQHKLESFFKGYAIGDLFFEVTELVVNKNLLEKQEFYLYFCDITYDKHTYPLFYIPVHIEKNNLGFSFHFDSLLYVNKKAVQFITQSFNEKNERPGTLIAFLERIIYLSEKGNHLISEIDQALKEAITYFGLSPFIDIHNAEKQISKGKDIHVTNRCYLGLFDKSDESLVNDYEDILLKLKEGDDNLAIAFQHLIDDFITNNPLSINLEIEDEWDNTSFNEKLVYTSPVPLNEEQRQILIATNKSICKYITVEGPPGTGKSHTITAIVCDSILKNQSVLVLSDKKEALDVVEDKITETINKVRLDKDFQNPILRLGKTGNTYKKILSTTSMEKIKEHYKATKGIYKEIERDINQSEQTLKDHIKDSAVAYEKIKLADIFELENLKLEITNNTGLPVDINEMNNNKSPHNEILTLRNEMLALKREIYDNDINLYSLFENVYQNEKNIISFVNFIRFIEIIDTLRVKAKNDVPYLAKVHDISSEKIKIMEEFIFECQQLSFGWFGYLFGYNKVNRLCLKLKESVPNDFDRPQYQLDDLKIVASAFRKIEKIKTSQEINHNFEFKSDFLKAVHQFLTVDIKIPSIEECNKIISHIKIIDSLLEKYKQSAIKFGADKDNVLSFIDNDLIRMDDETFDKLVKYLYLKNDINAKFSNIPNYNYTSEQKAIEELVTSQMAYKIDESVVDFFENHKHDSKSLSSIISKKQRFDKSSFDKLKNAFPCILVGIRDFAEYIPLESEIFDLVIIDEASQVSIAQAFPALLRGKKIVVLGDRQQFSNVKSSHARSTINREYLNRLTDIFLNTISNEPIKLERLGKFNIKTSILEFFERITNFNVMLKKHFRGYRELISYSNKYFYNDALQAIKIRTKSPDEIIRFSMIDHDGKLEIIENTNQAEISQIVAEVERIFIEENQYSVGIITPHTNQQKLLSDVFSKHPDKDGFDKKLKLKIMTFDTCQGEERDIILYSMVANPASDKLWGIFIKDRNSVDQEEANQIKLQRLNVGFSRAKEQLHFYLSKPIKDYSGSIGEALLHYGKTLQESKTLPSVSDTDSRSPMEKKILSWIQDTQFFKRNHSSIEIRAQFPLGVYLKQLDKRYNHPLYVVDFLLTYTNSDKKEYKIVIEYDGFEYHFHDYASVNKFNYGEYYTDQHIYREKVLEGYGCIFLRINRFNLGKDPVNTLNQRLESLVKNNISKSNNIVKEIHSNISGIQEGQIKECTQCNKIKPLIEFKDEELLTGYGRHCNTCKNTDKEAKSLEKKLSNIQATTDQKCPKCNSVMMVRVKRNDQCKFYGCSRFPKCKGTKLAW